MSALPSCIEIEPGSGPADAAIIWLHGLGASGHDFEPIVPALDLPGELALRFIFPHAPSIPVTINGGHVMPAWYDIHELQTERKFNAHQLLGSAAAVHALIDREMERGIASERILLAGFSQGGAVNYQAGLTYDKPLAGMLALSTYFPTADVVELHPANAGLPIRLCHGLHDQVLPLLLAQRARERLRQLGLHPELQTYPMAHEVCLEEIQDLSHWIQEFLPAQ